jgi:hypothetical protein
MLDGGGACGPGEPDQRSVYSLAASAKIVRTSKLVITVHSVQHRAHIAVLPQGKHGSQLPSRLIWASFTTAATNVQAPLSAAVPKRCEWSTVGLVELDRGTGWLEWPQVCLNSIEGPSLRSRVSRLRGLKMHKQPVVTDKPRIRCGWPPAPRAL